MKFYIGVCMECEVIVPVCMIFSAFMSSGDLTVDTSLSAMTLSRNYIDFNMLVLAGLVKGAERIVKGMFGQ